MGGEEDDEAYAYRAVLTTARLRLRRPAGGDHAAIAALAGNPQVVDTLTALPAECRGEPGEAFAIHLRGRAAVIGAAAYGPVEESFSRTIEIAVWIAAEHWGQGFGTEATQALIDRAFADERVSHLWCSKRATDTRARRIIEKCGFQFRERGMVRSPLARGAIPVERFVLERRNWRSLKSWGAPPEMRGGSDAGDFAA
jgi:RimJ/RimL family protein N-acetyltransferase